MDTRRTRARRLAALAATAGVLLAAAGCSSSGAGSTDTANGAGTNGAGANGTGGASTGTAPGGRPTGTAPKADPATWTRPACDRPAEAAPTVAPVAGSTRDLDLTSFDGTRIRLHWFPQPEASAAAPKPTVLMGPGWSLPGDTDENAVGVFGALNIATLRRNGFNVLTWDPRGFGQSDGVPQVDSKDFEGRDVQLMLDWVAAQPGVQVDGAGDPRVGMIGGSYGGGIQWVTAAQDCRVDALVPVIAWHSLETSLFKNDTPKIGWANILVQVGGKRPLDPHTTSASTDANTTGTVTDENRAWFVARGPGDDLVGRVRVPTLIVQGTVDTLFTLDEGITNYGIVRDNGVPVAMAWYCGGHGTCLTSPSDIDTISTRAMAWLNRWVRDDTSVDLGPTVDVIDQHGNHYPAADYPLPTGPPLTATGSGTLALTADGGAGPVTPPPGVDPDILSSLVVPVTPGRAANAVNVPVAAPASPVLVVGAPQVELTYHGTVPAGERPTRVFAQLVDDRTGLVLGNQITPIAVTLDGQTHTATVPLEVVAHAVTPGSGVTLQLVATTVAYAQPRLGGTVTFDSVTVTLPVAAGVTPKPS